MTGSWLPLTATALAAGLTWWCCIRPMARNRACHGAPDTGLQQELRAAREELSRLRGGTPPTDQTHRPETRDR
ncbi:hypothetical protein [Streptomyces diastatochromogenes]|uniref:Uncharacterized protein n=1 Tax=Streptomyces diastatochromogenes TaxID=42236 RepID=A0A233S9R3_STRDA|nr:hypothetical protein [Streptomyces diastatochromogenes]OXY92416.1 hypothetical protein BEK98_26980 [Streptomyces diastatochromogenes]